MTFDQVKRAILWPKIHLVAKVLPQCFMQIHPSPRDITRVFGKDYLGKSKMDSIWEHSFYMQRLSKYHDTGSLSFPLLNAPYSLDLCCCTQSQAALSLLTGEFLMLWRITTFPSHHSAHPHVYMFSVHVSTQSCARAALQHCTGCKWTMGHGVQRHCILIGCTARQPLSCSLRPSATPPTRGPQGPGHLHSISDE